MTSIKLKQNVTVTSLATWVFSVYEMRDITISVIVDILCFNCVIRLIFVIETLSNHILELYK